MRRPLSRDEAALWTRLAKTVKPMEGKAPPILAEGDYRETAAEARARHRAASRRPVAQPVTYHQPAADPPFRAGEDLRTRAHTLDANWDRKLAQGLVHPDFTLDLHGYSLDAAHSRLDHGLTLAVSQGARLVLLITGRARPSDGHGGRGERRGAIRAKFLDWLAHGSHTSRIAAIRPAHPRHGGAGAVYLVLRKAR